MRVELHDGLKNAQNISANRVVVYDDFDNPIALVVQVDGGQYVAATVTSPKFPKLLKAMGIDKTVLVTRIDPNKLPPLE